MRERSLSRNGAPAGVALACIAALGLLAVGVVGCTQRGGPGAGGEAVRLIDGIPVGVQDTREGALAAADNYVALASQSIEQDPATFSELVAQAYVSEARVRALAQAQQIRANDAQNMSNYQQGGRGIALIAARRLDSYTPQTVTVTSWLGGFVWGPHLAPRQTWNLVDTTLRWHAGRWLIVASNTDRTPAPVPSIVYVEATNNQSSAFTRLAGMAAPFYGTAR
jgi:hypothetical protein